MLRARDAMDRDFARVLNVGEPAAIAATRRGRIEAELRAVKSGRVNRETAGEEVVPGLVEVRWRSPA